MPSQDLAGLLNVGFSSPIKVPAFGGDQIVNRPKPALSGAEGSIVENIHGTTVIALNYRNGVLNVGDRRATAKFGVMYDKAEKVLPVDDYTLFAISGSFARAMEVVRYLRHSFKYFERAQLQPMSLDGKLSELAKV